MLLLPRASYISWRFRDEALMDTRSRSKRQVSVCLALLARHLVDALRELRLRLETSASEIFPYLATCWSRETIAIAAKSLVDLVTIPR